MHWANLVYRGFRFSGAYTSSPSPLHIRQRPYLPICMELSSENANMRSQSYGVRSRHLRQKSKRNFWCLSLMKGLRRGTRCRTLSAASAAAIVVRDPGKMRVNDWSDVERFFLTCLTRSLRRSEES